MDRLAPIIDAAKSLSPEERRRLVRALDSLESPATTDQGADGDGLAALRALSASVHSDFDDLSTEKYAHVAAASLDSRD